MGKDAETRRSRDRSHWRDGSRLRKVSSTGIPGRFRRACPMARALIGGAVGDIVLVGEYEIEIFSIEQGGCARSQWSFRADDVDFESAREARHAATSRRCGRKPWNAPGALRH